MILKRKILFVDIVLIFFIIMSTVRGQDSPTIEGKSCLWRISSEKNTVYLLGSVHILKKENYPLKQSIENAYLDAEKLVFEIHLDSAESLSTQMMIMSKGMFTDGTTLENSLDEETYTLVKQISQDLGLNIEQMTRFKPWFLTVTLMTLKLQRLGFNPNYGIDKYFFNKAKSAGKEIGDLETVKFQIDLFDTLSKMNQKEFILQTLRELDILEEDIDDLIDAWETGNTTRLDSLVLTSFREYPDIYQRFIYQRNMSWLPRIETYLRQDNNILVIVGAGHLLGDDGIIALLKKRGYTVRQL